MSNESVAVTDKDPAAEKVADEVHERRRVELARVASKLPELREENDLLKEHVAAGRKELPRCGSCGGSTTTPAQKDIERQFQRSSSALSAAQAAWNALRQPPYVPAALATSAMQTETAERASSVEAKRVEQVMFDAEQRLEFAKKKRGKDEIEAATKVRDAAGEDRDLTLASLERTKVAAAKARKSLDEAHARALRLPAEDPGAPAGA